MKLVRWTAKDEFDQPPGPAQGGDVYLVTDDSDLTEVSALEARVVVPVFRKAGHPLDGQRVIRHGTSGDLDQVVDDNGKVAPAIEVE
jgi:hypothetical protein